MAENKWYSTRIRIFGKTALREIVWVILGLSGSADPCFLGRNALPPRRRTCHDAGMGKLRRLQDIYRFPGFVALAPSAGDLR